MRTTVAVTALLAIGLVAVAAIGTYSPRPMGVPAATAADPPDLVSAPEFSKTTEWLQSKPLKIEDLRGKVVALHFWTFGCVNCQHNYPYYRAWQEKYGDKGLAIVGVHSPEFPGEADPKRVLARAEQNKLTFPIAVDNDWANWKNWNNRYWPTVYLIDKRGKVRYNWEGELDSTTRRSDQLMRQRIEELLAEK